MKKIALFALAALCVTAAQAVALSWTEGKGFDLKSATGTITLTVEVTGGASVPFYASAAGTSVFQIAGISLTRTSAESWDSTVNINFAKSNTSVKTDGHTSNGRLQNGTTTYTMVFSGYDADEKTWSDLEVKTVWANGDLSDGSTEQRAIFYDGSASLSIEDLMGTTSSSGLNLGIKATLSGEGVVPEPTALALLALGVAGLALKRKVA